MTITALIPTKNRAALLRRAINSVQSQKYKNVKICVRDNGSTDNTQEMFQGSFYNIYQVEQSYKIL